MKEIIINKNVANQRIDKYVRKLLNEAPLSFIYKLFRKKDIKINNHWVKENYILKENDILRIYVTDNQLEEFNKPKAILDNNIDLDIIYEDSNIIIINKPSGILIHGDINEKRITLSNKVISYLYKKGEYNPNNNDFIPSPVHRLDRNTSGIVIYAKNIISSQILMEEFKNHININKSYIALVKGKIIKSGIIDVPLIKDETKGIVKVTNISNELGKSAKTLYKPIIYNDEYSLLNITLITGRTHQIRVHMSYINHPLLGDAKYGDFLLNRKFENEFNYKNQFLHAYKIKFLNISGELNYLSNKEFIAKIDRKKEKILTNLYRNFSLNELY